MEKSQHPKSHLRKHSGEKSTSKKTFEKTQWNKVKILQPILPGSSSSSYQRQSGLQSHSKHAKRHLRKHSGENTVAKHSGEKSKSKKKLRKHSGEKSKNCNHWLLFIFLPEFHWPSASCPELQDVKDLVTQ